MGTIREGKPHQQPNAFQLQTTELLPSLTANCWMSPDVWNTKTEFQSYTLKVDAVGKKSRVNTFSKGCEAAQLFPRAVGWHLSSIPVLLASYNGKGTSIPA